MHINSNNVKNFIKFFYNRKFKEKIFSAYCLPTLLLTKNKTIINQRRSNSNKIK